MKIKGNIALIVLTIVAGILVIVSFALFLKKDETVNLPLTVVEYADFECPACGFYYPIIKQAMEKYVNSDNVTYEYRHYPLTTIHPYAYNAALASEAARAQGKFEEYASLLFTKNRDLTHGGSTTQDYLTDNNLIQYAVDLGLNKDKFITDMNGVVAKTKVDSDIAQGNSFGVQHTPTFVINGKEFIAQNVDSSLSQEEQQNNLVNQFTNYIDSKLALATKK